MDNQNNQSVVGNQGGVPQVGVQGGGQPLFTQEQVNEIVSKRVNELNVEKAALAQSIETYKIELQKANEQVTGYSEQAALVKVGVDPRFSSFLTFEARKKAEECKSSFEEALKTIVTESGSLYLPVQEVQATVEPTGQQVTEVTQQPQQQTQSAAPQQPIQPIQYLSSGAGSAGVLQSSAQSQEASFLQARLASRQGK